MTKTEFMEKYGNVEVKFLRYYKYKFTFVGTAADGNRILVMVGDDANDIYRFEVCVDDEFSAYDLEPFAGKVLDSKLEVIDGFED